MRTECEKHEPRLDTGGHLPRNMAGHRAAGISQAWSFTERMVVPVNLQSLYYLNYASDGTGGTKDARATQERQCKAYAELGINGRACTPADIRNTHFYQANAKTLETPRGAGLWLWKPYLILRTLMTAPPGQLVLYTDSDLRTANLDLLCRIAEHAEGTGMGLVSSGPFPNLTYCKRDCLVAMGVDTPEFRSAEQAWAGIGVYKACPSTMCFVSDWLHACTIPGILTEEPSVLSEHPGLQAHRHDQSVLSCLAKATGRALLSNEYAQAFMHPA